MYENLKWADSTQNSILALIDKKSACIPVDQSNTDYQEIMRLVDAGELTIAEPD